MMQTVLEVLLTYGIRIIGAVIAIFLTSKVAPWLNEKISKEQAEKLILITRQLVNSAEQTLKIEDPTGERRKAYVEAQLVAMGYELTEAVNAIIESQVLTLHQSNKK